MMYNIDFTPTASKKLAKYKKSNPVLYKKLSKLLADILELPRMGLGHPEPLKGGNDITYSRHISARDRIIYNIYDDKILVIIAGIEGHYGDKSCN